eukprot:CAMPEP_0183441756 /NCGR_PEP_ID=MMETSP0370-20130417/85783_1 /TAXON_ID=268820 /ORGANISM="Peridinium aciculiferum, Strain PAER-2" /LENGTH=45 /DNA_ID= /DNA_START= /DNA_END= /DNA_ORIENTATION=
MCASLQIRCGSAASPAARKAPNPAQGSAQPPTAAVGTAQPPWAGQ